MSEQREQLMAVLKSMGIAKAVIRYSGGGDSGQMDSVEAYVDEDEEKYNQAVDIDKRHLHLGADEIAVRVANKLMNASDEELSQQLMNWGYDLLEELNVTDWVNNDGGQGKIFVYPLRAAENDPAGPQIVVEHQYNEVTAHDEHYEL